MVQQGYYNKRIKDLEEREKEATEEYVVAKLRLQGIKKEKKQAFEYMNSAHYDGSADISHFEKEILSLKYDIKKKDKTIKKMNNTLNNKNGKIKSLNKIIEDKEHELNILKIDYQSELSHLQDKIAGLNKTNSELTCSSHRKEEIAEENTILRKENRGFKRDIKALNERIKMMDKTIEKKNREIQFLHERLNWQPVKPKTNIFDEIKSKS